MPRLILVLPDLFPTHLSDVARAALPRLAQLEQWLARGQIERTQGNWRQWLQGHSHHAALRAAPPASVAALAVANVPGTVPLWLATPVHWVAGLDTVRVHPAGLLKLGGDEQHALERDFQRVFAGSGWSLHATGRREMVLAGGAALNAGSVRSHDPALWLGADPREGLPAGPGAHALRRLGTEMEMWLHEHPVNRARHARGALSVSALWIWGGGAPMVPHSTIAEPKIAGAGVAWADDLFVDGLSKLEGFALEALPERWPSSTPMDQVVRATVLAVCALGAEPAEGAFHTLERHWIAPAFEQWRLGAVRSAALVTGAHAVTLARAPFRSLWRRLGRTRPWWEILLQC